MAPASAKTSARLKARKVPPRERTSGSGTPPGQASADRPLPTAPPEPMPAATAAAVEGSRGTTAGSATATASEISATAGARSWRRPPPAAALTARSAAAQARASATAIRRLVFRAMSGRLRAWERIHPADPRGQARVAVAEGEVDGQNPVKKLIVALVVEERVLQEREGDAVGDREGLPEEEIAAREEGVEEVAGAGELALERRDVTGVRGTSGELGLELVRRALPDPIEPVDEDDRLRPPGLIPWVKSRLGVPELELLEDGGRVGEDPPVLEDRDRHAILTADLDDRRAIRRVDVDPLEVDSLVAGRERDPLHVGRERDAVDTDHPGVPGDQRQPIDAP